MPFPWRDSASHGSISALANAAVPTEVQNALATRMGPAAADSNSNDFQELLEALVSPPSSVFFAIPPPVVLKLTVLEVQSTLLTV